jgi:hypothetical protein
MKKFFSVQRDYIGSEIASSLVSHKIFWFFWGAHVESMIAENKLWLQMQFLYHSNKTV